ncbi:MAG TPA: sulfide/dihydroorotate dehydrogenase-like FAD/NAD-binding protein, partial [Spirochaetota bacterium]
MFKIIEKYLLAPKIHFAKIKAPVIAAAARPGQFVILRITETGERLPLTIADFDRDEGSISLVFQEMGKSTKLFAAKKSGDTVMDFLGPQGNPSEIENFGRVVIVGGGVGIAPVF